MIELRNESEASAWVSTGLCLSRLVRFDKDSLKLARGWLIATLSESATLPPAGVVADIGQLLLGRRFQLRTEGALDGPRLQSAIRRYEDHFLGRLVDDSRMLAAVDAVARLADDDKAAAVGYLTGSLLRRIGFASGVAVNQGLIRQLARRPLEEIEEEGLESLSSRADLVELIAEGYENLTVCAEEMPTLIQAADVFTLENLKDLGALAQRIAIGQAVEASEWLGEGIPTVIRARRSEVGEVPTGMEDESTYPTGGFSSVTTVGAPENIVTSEFMYMERQGPGEPDLFDLRYAEGELLYYTRDETMLVRRRRQIYIALFDELASTRVKDPQAKWQRIVVLLGLIRIVVQRVAELLGQENLSVNIVFLRDPSSPGSSKLEPESRLCSLLLREWMELGLAQVWHTTLPKLEVRALEESRTATVQVVFCGKGDLGTWWLDVFPQILWSRLILDEEEPQLLFPNVSEGEEPNASDWRGLATSLLEHLWSG